MMRKEHELINGYLDETLTEEQIADLSQWIKSDPQHARQFAKQLLLHDQLRSLWIVAENHDLERELVELQANQFEPQKTSRSIGLAVTLAALLVVGLAGWLVISPSASAASRELQRMIAASQLPQDRAFHITALDDTTPSTSPATARDIHQPPVDDATLYLRGANHYVLIRHFTDGSRFITGSDGKTAWSIPPTGRVRVSADPFRFRGAVPGQRYAIPFIDLYDNLQKLQHAFDLKLVAEPDIIGSKRLEATRKPTASGGPGRVTIWFDPSTGTIEKMLLQRLPRARGGPRSVLLERLPAPQLAANYFTHAHHHEPEREVLFD